MRRALHLLFVMLLCVEKAAGDIVWPAENSRVLGTEQMMVMKKWRYSEAARSKSSGKGMSSKPKGSSSMSGKGMMMKRMMMMKKSGKGKGSEYSGSKKSQPSKPTSSPRPYPTSSPTIFLEPEDYGTCLLAMAVADIDRDDMMDPDEYVRFVNRLNREAFVGDTFEDIDPALQSNYEFLVGQNEAIDVTGSKPGQSVPDDGNLRRICVYTFTTLRELVGTAPTRDPSSGPAVFISECFLSMELGDRNQDNRLDQSEYVIFVSRFSNEDEDAESFEDLDDILQDNFYDLATDGYIDIAGSGPGETPTEELIAVCTSTQDALNRIMG